MISAIEKTAYHEAGHAMAFMVLKTRFSKVSIVPDDESLGRVTNDLPDSFFDEDLNANRQRSLYEKHILISLAGGLAEMKLTGVENTDGNAVDNSSVVELASRVTDSVAETEAYILWLQERAKNMVDNPWNWIAVEALAAALLHSKTLSARKAREIMKQARREQVQQRG